MQVLKLGPPVTALSLSPTMDMLATAHVNRRGIYMWSNAAVYGSGADIRPSELPVDARLPELASGATLHSSRPLRDFQEGLLCVCKMAQACHCDDVLSLAASANINEHHLRWDCP